MGEGPASRGSKQQGAAATPLHPTRQHPALWASGPLPDWAVERAEGPGGHRALESHVNIHGRTQKQGAQHCQTQG